MPIISQLIRASFGSILFVLSPSYGAPFDQPPEWSRDAIWYQIFVERFENGDSKNDPRPIDMEGSYPGFVPAGWKITPWGHDWYEQESWARKTDGDFHKLVAARRYGGDLQGVIDKLDYLQDLGITAIYFNPLNDAPSLHKYDARNYRHIDRNFGPDPIGDHSIINKENPLNPETWSWTSADRLFLKLINEIHHRKMRVIIDVSWNHTGNTFWAWKDVVKNQKNSRFRDWYDITSFDDPKTPENEFQFEGWLGVKTLPELKKVNVSGKRRGHVFEGDLNPEVKKHIFNVTRRWMDPNKDGDPSDGVDGFRLDVASHVPLGFWRDYRKFVRRINPEALLLGEAWWTKWPDTLMDPRPFLQGDTFDSVMHYQWYKPARQLFANAGGRLKPSEFIAKIKNVYTGYSPAQSQSLMNLVASHDSPRLSTSFLNKQKYKFQMGARGNKQLKLGPPDKTTTSQIRMMLLHQFTYLSAPHIWNGDELGMWGADDPDCRKPLLWGNIDHNPQIFAPDGSQSKSIPVTPNQERLSYQKKLISLRRGRLEWTRGSTHFLHSNDENLTLAYLRKTDHHRSLIAFNLSNKPRILSLDNLAASDFEVLVESSSEALLSGTIEGRSLRLKLAPLSGLALDLN